MLFFSAYFSRYQFELNATFALVHNRFKVRGSYGRKYGYNPCRSFAIGPAGSSDCYADVAVSCDENLIEPN